MTHLSERDIVNNLHALAAVQPSSQSTIDTIQAIRAALTADTTCTRSYRTRRIVLSGTIAASIGLILVGVMLSWTGGQANAASDLYNIASINGKYLGWVRVTSMYNQKKQRVSYYNTADGTFARIDFNDRNQPWMYEYDRAAEGVRWTHVHNSNEIRVGSIPPRELTQFVERATETIRIDRFIAMVLAYQSAAQLYVNKSQQDGLDRYDFEWGTKTSPNNTHTTVLVDPRTRLVTKTTTTSASKTAEYTYHYEDNDLPDIYALGVPVDCTVVDVRKDQTLDGASIEMAHREPTPTIRPAIYSRLELLEIAQSSRDAVADLEVRFTYNSQPPQPRNLMNHFWARVLVKQEKRYIERRYAKSDDTPQFERTASYNGSQSTSYDVKRAKAIITDTRTRECQTQGLGFFDMNLLNAPRPDGHGHDDQSLISLLKNGSARVRDHLEIVNDHLCHVIDTRELSVWLDAERSCVPIRQVFHNTLNANRPSMVFVADEVSETAPGVCFVTRGRKFISPAIGSAELIGNMKRTMLVTHDAEMNPELFVNGGVDDDFFNLANHLPEGTQVFDASTNTTWTVPTR